LEVLDLLVRAPLHTSSMSSAALARTVDATGATVLLDEADTVFGSRAAEHEELRALLNAGHRRGAAYVRMVGEGAGMTAKAFSVFAPVALAGIGDLPDTVMQRAVVVRMRRRAPGEEVQPFRFRDAREECKQVRDDLAAWAGARVDQLAAARPVMPEGITDRPADVWEPLLAVADAAGGDWPKRARKACDELVKAARTTDSGSLGVRLLADLRAVFREEDQLHTDTILDRLHALQEAPWGDLRGKPLDPRGLARRLREYGVKPVQVNLGGTNRRGYRRQDLHDTWTRYLPPAKRPDDDPLNPPDESATSATAATSQVSGPSPVADAGEVADASATRRASATEDNALTTAVAAVADVADFPEGVSARPGLSVVRPGDLAGPCIRCGRPCPRYGEGGHPLCLGCRGAA
ncbi:MAG: DUF3631 domain-containing protein, partial [Actinomycetota bacterium]|nr:DUF3631 domain-containing protein [Actinomycetota bacterium]